MTSEDPIVTPLLAGLAAIGGGSAAAGAATAIGTAATLAGAGTSIAAATKPAPKMPTIAAKANPAKVEAAKAEERHDSQRRQGYKATIFTDGLSGYSPAGKVRLGE